MTETTETRQKSCAERIRDHHAGREAQFSAWFAPLDRMDDIDVIDLAVAEVDGFHLNDHEKVVVEKAREGLDDEVVKDEDDEDSTVAIEFDLILDRAKEAIEDMRNEGHVSEEVLAVSTTVQMRVELSTGGPADYLTCEVDTEDRSVSDVRYHFADWFDHADERVDDDSPLAALCEYFAEIVDLGGRGY